MDENIINEAEKLKETQKKIIENIQDMGFNLKEADYNFGYIRGIEDLINAIYNATKPKFPRY